MNPLTVLVYIRRWAYFLIRNYDSKEFQLQMWFFSATWTLEVHDFEDEFIKQRLWLHYLCRSLKHGDSLVKQLWETSQTVGRYVTFTSLLQIVGCFFANQKTFQTPDMVIFCFSAQSLFKQSWMQTKNVSCVGLMAWGSPMSERSMNSNIYVFEICRLWCKGCHRRKKSDPWPPEGEILDKGGCCTVVGCKHCFSHFLVFSCWSCMLTHWILLAPGFDQPPWHVNHQCQTAIFSCGRSSNKASENVSFEIYQVGSLDCESSQKYMSILLPDKFRPDCNLLFKWCHYNRTVLVTALSHLAERKHCAL
jgi:hypothetical protein